MLEKLSLAKILFLDIETVPIYPSYEDVDEELKVFIDKKLHIDVANDPESLQNYEKAGIYSEFGKIICISVGFVSETRTGRQMRLKSFYHDDESVLLKQFKNLLEEHPDDFQLLCGHNAKEFDFPYICRRMLVNGIKIPSILDMAGKKPWEVAHLDTMQLWKFGDYKAYTSLALLCHIFGIPTPKDDINGADVAKVYYQENDLKRIKKYCEKDVRALIQVFLKFRGDQLIDEAEIHYSED